MDSLKKNEKVCMHVLESAGIKNGQTVLDFGCGRGTYTIPAAKIVGSTGIVYALDENGSRIKELSDKCRKRNITNVKTIKTNGELQFNFRDCMFHAVLLYDIFWYFPAGDPHLITLLKEIYRASKEGALVSVLPEHTNTEKLKSIIETNGFEFAHQFTGNIIHDDYIVNGLILNFTKRS